MAAVLLCGVTGEVRAQGQPPQGITVSGTVSDDSGAPLPGATVVVRGTSRGVITDTDGAYTIGNLKAEDFLEFSFLGMDNVSVEVGTKQKINIQLKPKANELDGVVVTAFGGMQKKESSVSSIATVNPSDLKIPTSNLTTALAGRMAGLISYQRSGEPGLDNAEFFIRGVTTFGYKKDPLILIDNNESSSTELARLQTDDIASFSIMKDATAVALYGSRGANGVILITTKSGAEGPAKFNVRFEESISQPTRLPRLADPYTYMDLHNEAVRTRDPLGMQPYTPQKVANTKDPNRNPYVYPIVDWYKMLFKDFSSNHHLNFSANGGGKIARYYVGGSLINDNGILNVDKRNNFNSNVSLTRYTLRTNVNINLTATTEMIARLSGSFDSYRGPRNGGSDVFAQVMNTNPVLFPAYFAPDENHKHTTHILFGNASAVGGTSSAPVYNNPYASMVSGYKESTTSQINIQFEIKQDLKFITEGLKLRGMYNTSNYGYFDVSRAYSPYYYQVSRYEKATDQYTLERLNIGTDWLSFSEGPKTLNTASYFESALNWGRIFGVHEAGAQMVFTMREYKETQGENGTNLQKSLPQRNLGLAGRATYAYDGRYLFEFNFGYNGSERFARKERFGFFPSVGAGWVISNETFWEGLKDAVNNLKIKATYGLAGNDAIGDPASRFFFLSDVNMNSRGAYFGTGGNVGYTGITVNRYANDQITWETAKKANASLEIGLFGQLDIQAEVYHEKRENILMSRSAIPTTMGLEGETPRANVGEAKSRGVDISVNYSHSFNEYAWIQGMGNFTYATNKYLVYEEPAYPDAPWKSHVGYSINQTWGYIAERLFIDDEEVRNSPTQFGTDYLGGDIKYMDINHDGKITDLDTAPIGYPTSPEIVYGFGASAGYKEWDFSFFFQGLARESFWINYSATSPFISNQRALLQVYADNHWSEDNRNEYALWPRLSPTVISNNNRTSTWFMRDGAFLRLKSVEFGYTLPEELMKKTWMQSLRVYLSGTNLLTFSKFKLWDPEMAGNGLAYPVQRVFNVGVQLNF
jgi:TonB-linked SusC/RagA family outer membrane protein